MHDCPNKAINPKAFIITQTIIIHLSSDGDCEWPHRCRSCCRSSCPVWLSSSGKSAGTPCEQLSGSCYAWVPPESAGAAQPASGEQTSETSPEVSSATRMQRWGFCRRIGLETNQRSHTPRRESPPRLQTPGSDPARVLERSLPLLSPL